MASMFTATPNIKKSFALINDLDSAKFPLLLSRILQKFHVKDESTFSEEEEEKLQKALSLSAPDLRLVVQTCEFIFHQAAYHAAKPTVLSEQLRELQLEEDKVSAIADIWNNVARDTIGKLRQQTLAPKQLEAVNWRLNLQMAQASQANTKEANAMFELKIRDDETQATENVRMEFTHAELYAFYNQLETIQGQLDALT